MSDEQTETTAAVDDLPKSEYPKEVKLENLDAVKGLFTVLWRNRSKQTAKIIGTEKEGDTIRAIYELTTDPDKGELCSSKFDNTQTVMVYDEDTLSLALLEK